MKTNKELVTFAKKALAEKWNYTYAHYGQVVTAASIESAAGRFPKQYTAAYKKRTYRGRLDGDGDAVGKRGADCIGLIKGFLWWQGDDKNPKYDRDTDVNEAGMLQRSKVKGKIDTMPDKEGILVYYSGHVGVYVGNGKVIEARGVDYGVVETNLKDRKWTDWSECPYVDYIAEETTYIVQAGDSLWGIAEKFLGDGKRFTELAQINGIADPEKISVGQVIKLDGTIPAPQPIAPQQPATPPTTPVEPNRALRRGDKGNDVRWVQQRLSQLGYALAVDGSYGPATESAVKTFQKDYRLAVDGVFGPASLAMAKNPKKPNPYTAPVNAVFRRGSRGDGVKWVQTVLVMTGFSMAGYGVDGSYGPATEKAVIAYQRSRGLKVDGITGPATIAAMKKE
ncbi:MAG: peptidoglycan-binding protein [Massilibacteroides sp.]|nr:peptidoglycan-binding protein [Massilibacteroides sp.]